MIYGVESSREIKKTYSSNLLSAHRLKDVIVNSEKGRLGRMMFSVS